MEESALTWIICRQVLRLLLTDNHLSSIIRISIKIIMFIPKYPILFLFLCTEPFLDHVFLNYQTEHPVHIANIAAFAKRKTKFSFPKIA